VIGPLDPTVCKGKKRHEKMASGHVQDVWGDMGKLDLPNSDEMQPCGLKAGTCSYGRGLRSWNRVLTPTNSR
jgi:hypothetical protein